MTTLNLKNNEKELMNKLKVLSKSIHTNLKIFGIITKSLNDDSLPFLFPKDIMSNLNFFFDYGLTEFLTVVINKITFCNICSQSANFGVTIFFIIS